VPEALAQQRLALLRRRGLEQGLDPDAAVHAKARLLLDPHAREAEEPDEEASVGQALVPADLAEPGDRAHRRRSRERVRVLLRDRAHHDLARAVEQVLDHLPVPRLEDVQRHHAAREEEDVRQREERDDPLDLALLRSLGLAHVVLERSPVGSGRAEPQPGSFRSGPEASGSERLAPRSARRGSSAWRSPVNPRASAGRLRSSALRARFPTWRRRSAASGASRKAASPTVMPCFWR
jgi:hypothetical protein